MIRDKHKDRAYFEKRLNRIQKRLREDIEMTDEISEKYLLFHYQDLVLDNEELVKLSYSIGASKEEIFPYYQGILSNLKLIASEGVPFDLAVNIFALGVLYSERKEEFLDDLKAIYEQMDHTDGLIEYYMTYLFHDKIVPFHSILEYQNMIENTYESVAKAQGSGIIATRMNLGMEHISLTIEVMMATGVLTPPQPARSKESMTNA